MTALGLREYFLTKSLEVLCACGEHAFFAKGTYWLYGLSSAQLYNDWVGVLSDPGM